MPTRFWRYRTGPAEESFTASAVISMKGKATTIAIAAIDDVAERLVENDLPAPGKLAGVDEL